MTEITDEPMDDEYPLPPDPTGALLPPLMSTEQGVERLQPLLKLLEEQEGESPLMQLLLSVGEILSTLVGIDQRLSQIERSLPSAGSTTPSSSGMPVVLA